MTQNTPLPALTRQFVSHFGEMGSRWGINRTVGQIYALLYLSPRALNAEEIAETLEFSRSNVSMGLKELQSWRLVNLRHHAGDRREYFEAPQDVWEIFRRLAEERRRREIEPTQSMLRSARIACWAVKSPRARMKIQLPESERYLLSSLRYAGFFYVLLHCPLGETGYWMTASLARICLA